MKIWIDSKILAPPDYVWCKSVEEAQRTITKFNKEIEAINVGYDAKKNNFVDKDFTCLLDWLNNIDCDCAFYFHGTEFEF